MKYQGKYLNPVDSFPCINGKIDCDYSSVVNTEEGKAHNLSYVLQGRKAEMKVHMSCERLHASNKGRRSKKERGS